MGCLPCCHAVTPVAAAERGDLSRYLNDKKVSRLSEDRILAWFVQLCLAVGYVHQAKILHRSVGAKPCCFASH